MMVADIFTALMEDRPYRKGMSRASIVPILKEFARKGYLDAKVVSFLVENYGEIERMVSEKQSLALQRYQKGLNTF